MMVAHSELLRLTTDAVRNLVQAACGKRGYRVFTWPESQVDIPLVTDGIDPVEYEGMQAWPLHFPIGRPGVIVLGFPTEGEGVALHQHAGDRILTVLHGEGVAVMIEGGERKEFPIGIGSQVFMREGQPHTFLGPLMCVSLHNPCVPFDDPSNYQLYEPAAAP